MAREKLRIAADYSDPETPKALDLLRDQGFHLSVTPVEGIPITLFHKSSEFGQYLGLPEIKDFIKQYNSK